MRQGGHRRLPCAGRQGACLLGVAAQEHEVATGEVREAQPLQGVDDRGDGSRLPGTGQCVGVEAALRVVVAELEGGVAEVPQDVAVVDVLADEQCPVERLRPPAPTPPSDAEVMEVSSALRQAVLGSSSADGAATTSPEGSLVPLSAP